MNAKQPVVLAAIFSKLAPPDLRWAEIESLLMVLGAEHLGSFGSRVCFVLVGVFAVFHRSHPKPVTDKGAVVAVRKFLDTAGVKP